MNNFKYYNTRARVKVIGTKEVMGLTAWNSDGLPAVECGQEKPARESRP